MILARVRRSVRERELLHAGQGVLVGCSGGPDSVALLHVLARLADELGVHVHVASVDHGLRPEAAAEVRAVGQFAGGLGLPFEALAVQLPAGASVQAQARDARYGALLACARRRGLGAVAVGHTLDDQAETVLERMLRGCSTRGLAGIAASREDGVIRPLIDCHRADVHAYVRDLPVIQDASNLDQRFLRVRIRERLMPALAAEDASIQGHLAALAEDARADRELVDALADALYAEARRGDDLELEPLRRAFRSVRRAVLGRWVRSQTGQSPGRAVIEALEAMLRGRGETLLPGERLVVVLDGRLRVVQPNSPED